MVDFAKAVPYYPRPGLWDDATLHLVEGWLAETPCHAGCSFDRVIFPERKAPELLRAMWPVTRGMKQTAELDGWRLGGMVGSSPLIGRWRIAEMEQWDRDYIDLDGPGFIELEKCGVGTLRFGAVEANLDCRTDSRAKEARVEFSFEGRNDTDPCCGRGWAEIRRRKALQQDLLSSRRRVMVQGSPLMTLAWPNPAFERMPASALRFSWFPVATLIGRRSTRALAGRTGVPGLVPVIRKGSQGGLST